MILRRKNRIQVSNIMKPLFFYVNLAKLCLAKGFHFGWCNFYLSSKFCNWVLSLIDILDLFQRYMQQYDDVELSVLGMGMHVLNLSLSCTFFCVFRL
ncbi:hypothetical protein HID58_056153 [Brassica napus]|uniref:Uncharacterized protein n=1 Tax=Brassica napus TaxID=3708 RepID=A0ABQ8AMF3_BRANA|nr:hypothetical protein HID58_056153 [Brassica napus]